MDKAAIIFSILVHDYEIMLWFWGLILLPVGIWHTFYFPAKKQYSAQQLAEISPKFEHIDSDYLLYSVFALGTLAFITIVILFDRVDHWSVSNFGIRFYPAGTMFAVGYAVYQASFALIKGVYPMGKTMSYAYDEENLIHRVAKIQILIALAAFIFVLVFFFITV